ncbi:TatD family hydrolase [Cereibacter sphaeroides]|nr:TatD family hydrolase [Cereibacter sphaeroides]
MIPTIVDSHTHLDFPDFDGERDAIIERARAAGVTRMVSICTKMERADFVRGLADTYPEVYWAGGIHPMSADKQPVIALEVLLKLAEHPKFVGIGETGLDYHYTPESAPIQQESLRVHIEAARQTGLPLIIHSRDADEDMIRILSEEHRAGAYTCVMHCFSSGHELAAAALDLGFYLSASGIAAFKKSEALREIFATAPVERILVETDAPYLAPPPHRGKRNEPAYTALTAQAVASVWGMDYPEFARQTSENFDRLFTKARLT